MVLNIKMYSVWLRWTALTALASGCAIGCMVLGGCHSHRHIAKYLVAADDSKSFDDSPRAAGIEMLLSGVCKTAPSGGADTRVWLFSEPAAADPKFNGLVRGPGDLKEFTDWYQSEERPKTGTYAAPVLRRFLAEARREDALGDVHGAELTLLFITDAGFNDLTEDAKIVRELARCRSVAAVWVGPVALDPGIQAEIETAFAPLREGDRLVVSNRLDMRPGLERLRAAIRKHR